MKKTIRSILSLCACSAALVGVSAAANAEISDKDFGNISERTESAEMIEDRTEN